MRQIFPSYVDQPDIEATYFDDHRQPVGDRPWVVVNMTTTLDGAVTVSGKSGKIGGQTDRLAFHALRASVDFIVVGAGTARAENYGPVKVKPHLIERRRDTGRASPPRLVLVSRSAKFDLATRLFTETEDRHIIATVVGHDAAKLASLQATAEVLEFGEHDVDLTRLLQHLGSLGAKSVLVEGGPHLNGWLIESSLIDEWCLTLGIGLLGGTSWRSAEGSDGDRLDQLQFHLARVIESDSHLLLRYVRDSQA